MQGMLMLVALFVVSRQEFFLFVGLPHSFSLFQFRLRHDKSPFLKNSHWLRDYFK
jgi:hypothetical protein